MRLLALNMLEDLPVKRIKFFMTHDVVKRKKPMNIKLLCNSKTTIMVVIIILPQKKGHYISPSVQEPRKTPFLVTPILVLPNPTVHHEGLKEKKGQCHERLPVN